MKIIIRHLYREALIAALLMGAAGGLSSCTTVVADASASSSAAVYTRGELDTTLTADYEHVYKAANKALAQLEFKKDSDNKDALTAVLVARTAEDKKVHIVVHQAGLTQTGLSIRVDLLGDKALSLAVLDKIKANL